MPQNTKKLACEFILNNNNNSNNSSNENESVLSILHFNDVYNIEPNTTEPKAGAARFMTCINSLRQLNADSTLILFSGDAFSPSALSLITKGKQMLACLNKFGINAACIGNHDFDFGVDVLAELISESQYPWLMSNVLDLETKRPLANAHLEHILTINKFRIGIIGLVEKEWIETLSTIGIEDLIYEPFELTGQRLARYLKNEKHCDYVIALTHMRMPNDVLLAEKVKEIDLILGGHDHNYSTRLVNKTWIIKSGTDFRNLTRIELKNLNINKIEKYTIDSSVEENEEISLIVDNFSKLENKEYDLNVLASVKTVLDSRFTVVRLQESNIANLICDILMEFMTGAHCCLVNSGTFRSDCVNEAGTEFTLGDLKKLIPFPDQIVMIQCKGKQIHEALENSVSMYPKLEGRFAQVAGINFEFDPNEPPSQRIDPKSIKIKNAQLDLDKNYNVVVKDYMREGKDGFTVFNSCPVLIDSEQTPLVFTIVENYFRKKRFQDANFCIEPRVENRIVTLSTKPK